MKLVLLGLVMIAMNLHSSDSDSIGSDNHHSDFEGALSRRKRKNLAIQNDRDKRLKSGGKEIVGLNQSLKTLYACKRGIDSVEGTFNVVTHHMHTMRATCFPKDGLPCLDCVKPTEKLFKAVEMLEHNNEHHAKLAQWHCRFCGTQSLKSKWVNHLAHYTKIREALAIFEGWPDNNLKVFKKSKSLAEIMKAANVSHAQEPHINDNNDSDFEDLAVNILNNLGNKK